jgi:hypothetical protein
MPGDSNAMLGDYIAVLGDSYVHSSHCNGVSPCLNAVLGDANAVPGHYIAMLGDSNAVLRHSNAYLGSYNAAFRD